MAGLSPDAVTAAFAGALTAAGATVVESISHHFPGTGLTTVLILAGIFPKCLAKVPIGSV